MSQLQPRSENLTIHDECLMQGDTIIIQTRSMSERRRSSVTDPILTVTRFGAVMIHEQSTIGRAQSDWRFTLRTTQLSPHVSREWSAVERPKQAGYGVLMVFASAEWAGNPALYASSVVIRIYCSAPHIIPARLCRLQVHRHVR